MDWKISCFIWHSFSQDWNLFRTKCSSVERSGKHVCNLARNKDSECHWYKNVNGWSSFEHDNHETVSQSTISRKHGSCSTKYRNYSIFVVIFQFFFRHVIRINIKNCIDKLLVNSTDSASNNDSWQEKSSWSPATISRDCEEVPACEVYEHMLPWNHNTTWTIEPWNNWTNSITFCIEEHCCKRTVMILWAIIIYNKVLVHFSNRMFYQIDTITSKEWWPIEEGRSHDRKEYCFSDF